MGNDSNMQFPSVLIPDPGLGIRSALLELALRYLGQLPKLLIYPEAGNRDPLAAQRIRDVLDRDFQSPAFRSTSKGSRNPRVNPKDGGRSLLWEAPRTHEELLRVGIKTSGDLPDIAATAMVRKSADQETLDLRRGKRIHSEPAWEMTTWR